MRGVSAAILLSVSVGSGLGSATQAAADTTYYCTPIEPRVTAPDRLVSVEITLRPNGAFGSVVYRAANGATYDRGSQYVSTNKLFNGQYVWIGALRGNRNVGMVGAFYQNNGRVSYVETVHDNLQGGKVVSEVTSICDGTSSPYAGAAPTPAPVPAAPSQPSASVAPSASA